MQVPSVHRVAPKFRSWKPDWLPTALLFALTMIGIPAVNGQSREQAGDQKQSKAQEKSAAGETQSSESTTEKEDSETEKAEPKKVKIGGIEWYVDYDAAMKVAQKEKKPMWLHFGENPG